ncbi:MAG: hypothetical protein ACI4PI_02130 [Oscillospiraceae bacterium]
MKLALGNHIINENGYKIQFGQKKYYKELSYMFTTKEGEKNGKYVCTRKYCS